MKTIRIKFVDFFDGFDVQSNDFIDALSQKYKVVLSDDPEYLFYSCFGFEHLKYSCVRIFFTGECITPNFDECDYAIGFDRLDFGERYLRLPLYQIFQYRSKYTQLYNRKEFTAEDLAEKKGFCSFVYSNCFAQDMRTRLFNQISTYKHVDSGGRYMNNIGGAVADKDAFQSGYKFSIACENTSYDGYATEKIVESFAARTIPIYYGDPRIALDFNSRAFINCHEYHSFKAIIKRIEEIDNNDDLYISMQNEDPLINFQTNSPLNAFLYNIFDKDIKQAFRRPNSKTARSEAAMKLRHSFYEENIYNNYTKVKNQFIRLKTVTLLTRKRKK